MAPRIYTAKEKHFRPPAPCPHCAKAVLVGQEVYDETDAPATAVDAHRAKLGQSYATVIKVAHAGCNPRATQPLDEFSTLLRPTGT
jgi:hypothetical protein